VVTTSSTASRRQPSSRRGDPAETRNQKSARVLMTYRTFIAGDRPTLMIICLCWSVAYFLLPSGLAQVRRPDLR